MVHRPSSLTPNQSFYPCRSEWNHRPCLLPSRKADCCYYCFAVSVFYATSNGTANDWFFTGSYTDFRSALDNVSTKPRRIFHPPFTALDWSTVCLPTRPKSVNQTLSAVFVYIMLLLLWDCPQSFPPMFFFSPCLNVKYKSDFHLVVV